MAATATKPSIRYGFSYTFHGSGGSGPAHGSTVGDALHYAKTRVLDHLGPDSYTRAARQGEHVTIWLDWLDSFGQTRCVRQAVVLDWGGR